MKLLIDMNLSPAWVSFLADAGFDATHWSSIGAPDARDSVIFAYAKSADPVVLTHDHDFGAILAATGGDKPSVVQIRADDIDPRAIGPQIVSALRQMTAELQMGALLTIDPARTRLRLLPLGRRSTSL